MQACTIATKIKVEMPHLGVGQHYPNKVGTKLRRTHLSFKSQVPVLWGGGGLLLSQTPNFSSVKTCLWIVRTLKQDQV